MYTTGLEKFVARRNKALTELDIKWVRRQLPGLSSDEVALITLHKTRYEATGISDELRHQSRRWLQENGFGRYDGCGEFLPSDQLPDAAGA